MRLVFMGTPHFATPLLNELHSRGHDIAAVYTQPPRPAGRGMAARPSAVQMLAESLGLPVFSPRSLRSESEAESFEALKPDVAVVAAYGLLLPKAFLEAPRFGCLNLHGSLLPRWRGAAPVQRAVMAGDAETGVGVMRMEEGLDTGPVACEARVAIGPETTAGELYQRLAQVGAPLMAGALEALERGELVFTPQSDQGVTYAQKIDKAEARMDWRKSAAQLHNLVRGLAPSPGAFFEADFGSGPERVKALQTRIEDARRRSRGSARRRRFDRLRRRRPAAAPRAAGRQRPDGVRRIRARSQNFARRADWVTCPASP